VDGDGNGWVECRLGHRHWGVHGAAGLLVYALDEVRRPRILMQHRASWTNEGDSWGVPGGARDSHEDASAAALREAHEEAGVWAGDVTLREVSVDDHGGWTYDTVLADARTTLPTTANQESESLAWIALDEVETLTLHPGFAGTWLRHRAVPTSLVVDGLDLDPGSLASLEGRLLRDPEGVLRFTTSARASVNGDAVTVFGVRGAEGADSLLVTGDRGLQARADVPTAAPTWLLGLL
jgi:8-oxo-dGTP pyrophosphatase MutT (NUDIX family)